VATKEKIRACFGKRDVKDAKVKEAERLLTLKHAEVVKQLLGLPPHPSPLPDGERGKIDVIGFHGQTLIHDPAHYFTLQIGDGALLAKETGIDVVNDFRSADVKAGGHGAPFLPLYHQTRAETLKKPMAVLNIGGVANVTWVGEGKILAFDTGPGNALVDDFMLKRKGKYFDDEGKTAKAGKIHESIVQEFMKHPYFAMKAPKSLDRNNWNIKAVEHLSTEDGVATLSAFTVAAVKESLKLLPQNPVHWCVAGGGRYNQFMMEELQKSLIVPVTAVEKCGWNGDALEAEGFAYLAVRSLLKEPLSLPSTTGVPKPTAGGTYNKA
jgi:anhydro-N-acetylmuramic acid kinase